jgi:hypothetical protein
MFEFIEKLYEGDVEFKWVINHFSDGEYDGTSNTHVTLNKYLNALKIFGIKVKKVDGKYKMLSPLYKISADMDDLKSVNLLKKACKTLPDGKNKKNFEEFLHAIEIRYDENAQGLAQIVENTQNINLDFYQSEMVEQVKLCEKYCQEKQKLEIIYLDDKENEKNILCSPMELVYKKRKICLNVLGSNGSRIYEIPIDSIKSLKQLPIAAPTTSVPTTVVFRIKNRLAKNYKLRDCERLETVEDGGSLIIVNKNEDFNVLLKRLMRYGKECEIISPKFLKEEMINLINKTLSNYQ